MGVITRFRCVFSLVRILACSFRRERQLWHLTFISLGWSFACSSTCKSRDATTLNFWPGVNFVEFRNWHRCGHDTIPWSWNDSRHCKPWAVDESWINIHGWSPWVTIKRAALLDVFKMCKKRIIYAAHIIYGWIQHAYNFNLAYPVNAFKKIAMSFLEFYLVCTSIFTKIV